MREIDDIRAFAPHTNEGRGIKINPKTIEDADSLRRQFDATCCCNCLLQLPGEETDASLLRLLLQRLCASLSLTSAAAAAAATGVHAFSSSRKVMRGTECICSYWLFESEGREGMSRRRERPILESKRTWIV